jgi:putative ABC transport system ATP-binding protein
LADRIDHRPAELSGGQMQRVAVARALMMDPPLILADEPTGNLDSSTGAAIMELLRDVSRTDGGERAVVMVTHNLEAASQTDRVITVQDGAVTSDVVPMPVPGGGRHSAGVRDHPTEIIPTVRDAAFASHLLVADPPRRRGRHSAHRF